MTPATLVRLVTRHTEDNRAPADVLRWKEAEVEALRAELKRVKEATS